MDKKKPKSHWFLTDYTNGKRMYKYNMSMIKQEKENSSVEYPATVNEFVETINKDEQKYSQKANKQMKFAKWGALFGLVGPVAAMSLGFFIFSLATAMLPGQFLITTGIAVASALTLFGLLPRWLAHRSHKRVRLAQKYKSKVDTLEKADEKTNAETKTETKTETKSDVKTKTKKRTSNKEDVYTNDLTYTIPAEEETEGIANVETYNLSGILKDYKPVSFSNQYEENGSVLTNSSTDNQVVENVDAQIVDNTTADTIVADNTTEVTDNIVEAEIVDNTTTETIDNTVETENVDDSVITIDDAKETVIEEVSDSTAENNSEATPTTTEAKSDQTVTEEKEEVSKQAPKKVGRYKFEVISTRADKKGKGVITTKVVAFSANSQEAFLEKMRVFCSNRSKNKKRLDTEVEQSSWLSEGEYPTTLQFKVTDIFHEGRTVVSKVYTNAPDAQKGENIQTFIRVVDSLRKTWSARANKKSSNENSQEYKTGISSEVVTPNTYTDVSGSDFSIKKDTLKFETVTPSTYTDVTGSDFSIKTKAEKKDEYTPNTYTDVTGSDFTIKTKTEKKDKYTPNTYTDVTGSDFTIKAQTKKKEDHIPNTYTDVSGSDFSIKLEHKKPVEYKIVSEYQEWDGKKKPSVLRDEESNTTDKTEDDSKVYFIPSEDELTN